MWLYFLTLITNKNTCCFFLLLTHLMYLLTLLATFCFIISLSLTFLIRLVTQKNCSRTQKSSFLYIIHSSAWFWIGIPLQLDRLNTVVKQNYMCVCITSSSLMRIVSIFSWLYSHSMAFRNVSTVVFTENPHWCCWNPVVAILFLVDCMWKCSRHCASLSRKMSTTSL